ncbi:hypothetical protein J2793_006993 [Paraburkholderia caledonica]|uniref:Uncharacterized protein n=1 Tax=Paraburkholderia caledonica TaxID=134536 RepID=A0AB73IND1_9BURK|nr:hypothetical protein [Paraburkholderia caledonica]
MATLFIEIANRYCRFFAIERAVEQLTQTVGAASSQLQILSADLAPFALRHRRAAHSISEQLSSIAVVRSSSTRIEDAVMSLMLSSANHRLRHFGSLISTPAQLVLFESAISELEKLTLLLERHVVLQRQVIYGTARLIRCLQKTDSWEDV